MATRTGIGIWTARTYTGARIRRPTRPLSSRARIIAIPRRKNKTPSGMSTVTAARAASPSGQRGERSGGNEGGRGGQGRPERRERPRVEGRLVEARPAPERVDEERRVDRAARRGRGPGSCQATRSRIRSNAAPVAARVSSVQPAFR